MLMTLISLELQEEVQKAIEYLNKEFEMKDLGKTKLCLGLQIEHLADESSSINMPILRKS